MLYNNIVVSVLLSNVVKVRGDPTVAGRKDKANKAVKTKRVKGKTNWILCIAVIALVIYVAVRIVDQNVRIQKAKEELSELDNYKTLQDIRMEELKHFADAAENNDLDLLSDYIEKIARENLDYVKSGEVEFINISGN